MSYQLEGVQGAASSIQKASDNVKELRDVSPIKQRLDTLDIFLSDLERASFVLMGRLEPALTPEDSVSDIDGNPTSGSISELTAKLDSLCSRVLSTRVFLEDLSRRIEL